MHDDNVKPILKISRLSKIFGNTEALKGIDISIEKPGVYGFLGPNGAGKTTTFKLISTLLKPSAGEIMIGGYDVERERSAALSNLGIQFDSPSFYPYLSGRENLLAKKLLLQEDKSLDIEYLINLSGLGGAVERPFKEYSWGMKQRLSLAASLISDPKLLLLDEPTNGLDPAGIAYIKNLLPRLAVEQNITVLLSSHRMDDVQEICDEVIIIHEGSIIARGSIADLASSRIIEIRCSDSETAASLLREKDGVVSVNIHYNNLIQVISPQSDSETIGNFLGNNSITVEEIREKEETLEDAFLRLTGIEANDS